MALQYGQVKWKGHLATADQGDAGPLPDITPVAGFVDFVPSRTVTYDTSLGTLVIKQVTAGIDAVGVLRDGDGNDSVTLISSYSADLSHQGWTWEARFRLNNAPEVGPFPFLLPVGAVVNLEEEAPVYLSEGVAIIRGPSGVAGATGAKGDKGDPGLGNVNTVNGKFGPNVVLTAADVGAQPAGTYATTAQLASAVAPKANAADLAPVAFSGDYNDLLHTPTGGGDGVAVLAVNGIPGPEVTLDLADVADINIPRRTVDDYGNEITPGPIDGAQLTYDGTADEWTAALDNTPSLEELDARYAPANYQAPYFQPVFVMATGDPIPADFPNGGLVYNKTTNAWSVHVDVALKPPVAPTGLAVVTGSATANSIGLTWNAVTTTNPAGGAAATSYLVFQGGVQVKTVSSPGTTITGLAASTTYAFRVAAVNGDGTGPQCAAVNGTTGPVVGTPPGAPGNLRVAVAATQTTVGLAWDAATPGSTSTTGYRVYRNGTTLVSTFTGLTGNLTGLTAATTYSLTVRAYNSVGEGAASNVLSVTTVTPPPGNPPGAPSNFAAGIPTTTTIPLGWTAGTPDATYATLGVRVYRNGTTLMQTLNGTVPAGTLINLTAATTYALTLRAYNAIGESPASNSISVTTASAGGGTFTPRFRVGSYYEKALPATGTAPVHPNNAAYLSSMAAGAPAINLVGGAGSNTADGFWPGFYQAKAGDAIYHIKVLQGACAPELKAGGHGLRIPDVAKRYVPWTSTANDYPSKVWNPPGISPAPGGEGFYVWSAQLMWKAGEAPVGADTDRTGAWVLDIPAGGAASAWVYYQGSYGHSADAPSSGTLWPSRLTTLSGPGTGVAPSFYQDDPRNGGYRGCNTMIRCIEYDRVKAEGVVNHVSEVFYQGGTANAGRWPMTSYENNKGGSMPEGTRLRIKTTVNVATVLANKGLTGARLQEATAIAKGWQQYGCMIADNTGNGNHKIKLENTYKSGRGNLWAVVNTDLNVFAINSSNWEFIADGFDAP